MNEMAAKIRTAAIQDISLLEELYKDFLADMCKYDGSACSIDAHSRVYSSIEDPRTTLFVAEKDPGIVGLLRLCRKQRYEENGLTAEYIKLTDLYVVPDRRENGIASELLRYAVLYAKRLGINEVTLKVDKANGPAHRLYRRLGFHDFITFPHDRIMMKYEIL